MIISPGSHLGPYVITSRIGAGGMGEVFRARDGKLGRDVAIKVLPAAFAQDAERLARFRREAQVLASLNHPNIAAIHGLEESDGVVALALELVEGEDLAERLKRGPIPVDEAMAIAKQLAEGLEAAHEKGVVHRDLKPANLKLTKDGAIKILDFGLAKAYEGDGVAPGSSGLSQSPTMLRPTTEPGVILGTAAYMSPEQARGKPVDRRADIWACGVVVFEMLTGKRLFSGETVSDTLAAVLKTEPDWGSLPALTPPGVRRLLRRCLEKDPRRRVQGIGEMRIAIEDALAGFSEEPFGGEVAGRAAAHRPHAVPWPVTALLVALASVMALGLGLRAPWRGAPKPKAALRLSIELGAAASLSTDFGPAAILSPDGRLLAFVASQGAYGQPRLHLRRLEQLDATALAETDGARDPFFSPDGEWIAFFADGKLRKVPVAGGPAVTLCDAAQPVGGSWAEDGTIVFTPSNMAGVGLSRVSAAGGTPQTLTTPDPAFQEITHRWPQVLPGRRAVLYTAGNTLGHYEDASLVVRSLEGETRKVLHRGGYHGRYLPSGHLVFVQEGTLFATPFDLGRLEPTGEPVPALAGLTSHPESAGAQFAFSRDGTLVYQRGDAGRARPIQWMDQEGKLQPLPAALGVYHSIRFSPDGRRLALDVTTGRNRDVWVYEWERDTLSRLTIDPSADQNPVWTSDGRRIAFLSARADQATGILWQRADGSGKAERLTESRNLQIPTSWHPNGKFLAFAENHPQTSLDILVLPLTGDEASGWRPGEPTVFLRGPSREWQAAFSPDGRWLAYASNESGRSEVYVRPFPGPGGRWPVSTAGGSLPTWSRSRRELFYIAEDWRIMVAAYTAESSLFRADKPRVWSPGLVPQWGGGRLYDLHPGGDRVAVVKGSGDEAEARRDKVVLIQNFFDELRRIAPLAKP